MKAILLPLLLLAAAIPGLAQGDAAGQAERDRIARERSQADSRLATQEVACYKKFAVSDCLNAARATRREILSDLRRQELTLNDADRKRRAGDRVLDTEQRSSAQKQDGAATQRAESVARRRDKEAELAQRAADRAQTQASAPQRAGRTQKDVAERSSSVRATKEQKLHNGAEELRRYKQRQQEALERRDRVAKRLADQARPGVKPLPVPP